MNNLSRKVIRKRTKVMRITGLTGELLLTVGALLALFLSWHLFWNDAIQGARQNHSATELAQKWRNPEFSGVDLEPLRPNIRPSGEQPPVTAAPAEGQAFALLYVPRFGEDFVRSIAEGTDLKTVLNSRTLGIGRYLESNLLGQEGNFAIAGHRTTWGATFGDIGELRIGDRIYVEVAEGWHSYQFRNHEYVWATEIDVLNSFPKENLEQSRSRVITLTSCHPKFSEAERIIAYGVYEGWYPRQGGPPVEIAEIVKKER